LAAKLLLRARHGLGGDDVEAGLTQVAVAVALAPIVLPVIWHGSAG